MSGHASFMIFYSFTYIALLDLLENKRYWLSVTYGDFGTNKERHKHP